MSSWFRSHLEPTPSHTTYLLLTTFLIIYALFSHFIRNRLHLSEPPLALLYGIAFGPRGADVIDPTSWGIEDNITQEATRVIVGLQVLTVGVDLPKTYFSRHWKSVAVMLGPVMFVGWVICAGFVYLVLKTKMTTAMVVGACLTPTDPVLAAAVLAESTFSVRVPARLKHVLSAESACNDGVSFPFLYIGLMLLIESNKAEAVKEWFLGTLLWQCTLGMVIGLCIGTFFNRVLRLVERYNYIDRAGFLVFYFLLAVFSVGIGSTLGIDDFLVAFGAGYGFAWDGWFRKKMRQTQLPAILDLILNASMFVYVGTIIPWDNFTPTAATPYVTPGRLIGLLVLVLLFRRIPIVLAMKPWTPDIKTWPEALFCGHFGPMGLGGLFLAIEARAKLENGGEEQDPHTPKNNPHEEAIQTVWPVVCFIVFGSTLVHGLSVAAISLFSHFSRHKDERTPLLAQERDGLGGMVHHEGTGDSEGSISGTDSDDDEDDNEVREPHRPTHDLIPGLR